MIMEVMAPSPPVEFHFDSTSTSPFISAPGSPQPFGIPFYSAPTSPTRLSAFYTDQFDDFSAASCDSPTVISDRKQDHDDVDFEFNFGGHIDKTSPLSSLSVSAAELFHAGQIKPFQPSSKLQFVEQVMGGECDSPTQNSPEFFPTSKNNFAETETQAETETEHPYQKESTVTVRGDRNYKGSRSLPTFRISDMLLENGNEKTLDSSSTTGKWGWRVRGWRLKDILLFRSASDGRVMEKHPLKKYELLNKVSEEVDVVKVSSFRSSESVQSSSSSSKGDSRKGGPPAMSAHEIHYTANRAASEEKKRRTFLPYKQTLLGGCLGFNPAVHDRNTGTLGLSTRGR